MEETVNTRPRLSDEERRKLYEKIARRQSLGAIYARHRDPDMYVKWVRDDKQDIARHKLQGFTFATDNPKTPEAKRNIDCVVEVDKDGFYRLGDVILMEILRELYEHLCAENERRSVLAMGNPKKVFREEARKVRIPTYERDEFGEKV